MPEPKDPPQDEQKGEQQQQALAAAIEAVRKTNPEQFRDALQKNLLSHFQPIWKLAFGAGKGEGEKRASAHEDEVKSLREQLAAKDEEMKKLQENAPDVAAYEKSLQDARQKHKDLQEQIKEIREQHREEKRTSAKRQKRDAIVQKLISKYVDDLYAQNALGPEVDKRLKVEEDGERILVRWMDKDGLTPVPVPEHELVDAAAEEIFLTVDQRLIKPQSPDRGGGSQNGGGGDAHKWDQYRERGKAAAASTHEADKARQVAHERLGLKT